MRVSPGKAQTVTGFRNPVAADGAISLVQFRRAQSQNEDPGFYPLPALRLPQCTHNVSPLRPNNRLPVGAVSGDDACNSSAMDAGVGEQVQTYQHVMETAPVSRRAVAWGARIVHLIKRYMPFIVLAAAAIIAAWHAHVHW
jgi:hypothetical protein